jgi:hypothetical protein
MKWSLRRRIVVGLIIVAAALAIGSCSIPGASYIRISNISGGYTLDSVYITGHSSNSWGSDWLTPSLIRPGKSVDFQINPGLYDVQAWDPTSVPPFEAIGVQVSSGNTTVLYYNGATLTE